MLPVKPFNVVDAFLLLGAADPVVAQLSLDLLQLQLILDEGLVRAF